MNLIKLPSQEVLSTQADTAKTFKKRLIGLIGTSPIESIALHIPRCNWVHTLFMSYPIDVIYLDKSMKICKIDRHLKPWRFAAPVLKAHSVVELIAGSADKFKLKIGEELHVGH